MGEVYRARDSRLAREVALKVLPDEFAADRERLQRFQREARAASALNHPSIVTIYELGLTDDTSFIAMELVEGHTLRALLTAGPLPLRKLIPIAAQVADGLAKAHEAGIVHRDLKPENLMVSRDGFVKILDFGLAKLAATGNPESSSDASTLGGVQTSTGVLLGTVGYMSPEQAGGRPLDFRSDQFSFGAVLYEMATGKPAFRKAAPAETLAAILRDHPEPVASVNPQAPAPLCWVIERCLAKEPGERYASTRDLARDLAAVRERISEALLRRVETRPSNLPAPRTAFVGRDREVAAVEELLLRPDVQLVTLTGPGGIGKTRLALEVARHLADRFPGGTYFIPLAPVSDAALVASVIVQTLGLHDTAGQTPLQTLKEYLQNSSRVSLLLLFDNFEHMLSASPVVAELLASGPGFKVLVTSRAPLHVYGEQEFPVPTLAVPDARLAPPPAEMVKYPAVDLFLQRARAVKPDFEISKENAAAVANICARLDGLPLAIELAAARVKLLSPAAIETRLESRLQLLTGGARDLPARQQTLRGAMDWSYDLLNAAEQKLFRRLSVFVGGCTLEAVEAVCDTRQDLGLDILEGMASMVDKSLAQQLGTGAGEPRYAMLETIREYGLEQLASSGEEAPTRRAHAAYCLVLAEEGTASSAPEAAPAEMLDRFELEHDNFRAALDWLTQSGNAEWGMRLGSALFRFWETREHFTEGRDRLARLLQLPGAAAHSKERARTLFAAGVLAIDQGDYTSAQGQLEESLKIARELQDNSGIAVSLNALAVFSRDRGELQAAGSLFQESLEVWRELDDRVAAARALSNLASVVRMQGDYARARSLYEQCRARFAALGDRTGMAWSLDYQGDVARDQGDAEAARSFYEQSLAAFRELEDPWGIAGTLADLGNLARDSGDCSGAQALYAESMEVFQGLGHKRGLARLLDCYAGSAALQSQPERALRLAGAAAALRQTLGAPLSPADHARLEKNLDPARRALPGPASSAAWMEGWAMSLERALKYALVSEPA